MSNRIQINQALVAAEKIHNLYRKKHGAPPLQLDDQLNEKALKCAQAILNGHSIPSDTEGLGRNEYMASNEDGESMEVIARDAVIDWYSHLENYNWDLPIMSKNINALNATQILWKTSRLLGVGIASVEDKIVLVALYSPTGNVGSHQQQIENVQKATW